MDNKINIAINDGDAFYGQQASINFNPTMVFFDFKNVTPRVDERSESKATFVIKHNVVMVEPFHAKLFRDLLDRVLKDYETQFGKIEKPQAIKNLEKKRKKGKSKGKGKKSTVKHETPSYFG